MPTGTAPPRRVHAINTDDVLADHDAVEIATRIKRGEISAREAERAAIDRIQRVNPELAAIAYESFERPRRSTDKDAPLFGVPTLIKDNIDVEGWPSNHGSAAFTSKAKPKDDPYGKQFMSTGMTVLGKSRMPEFGLNASTEFQDAPPTRNPWNTAYSVGASSGGSAALVAAGAVPIAHGNDGGGSIRIPAAAAGLVGLKPSRGRHIVGGGAQFLPINMISEGVVTRTVRDTAAFTAACEKYWRNQKLPPIGQVEGPARRRLRVGLFIENVAGGQVDAQTQDAVEMTAKLLDQQGHRVTEMPAPPVGRQFVEDFVLYYGLLATLATLASASGPIAFERPFHRGALDGLTKGLGRHFQEHFYRFPGALRRLQKSSDLYARVFDDYDVVLTPVVSNVTPELGYLSPTVPFETLIQRLRLHVTYTPLQNVTGAPGISLPVKLSDEGLPIGVQLAGAHGDERTLLELAYALEEQVGWPRIAEV